MVTASNLEVTILGSEPETQDSNQVCGCQGQEPEWELLVVCDSARLRQDLDTSWMAYHKW